MVKFLFWLFLLANCLAFALFQGYFGDIVGEEHEPARVGRQLNADKFKLISASAALAPPPAAVAAQEKPAPIACIEIGNFLMPDAKRFETALAALALGDRQSRHNVSEVASHIVYIPSLGSKEAAAKKTAELRQLGISNFFVINDNSNMRWAISLGIFKTEAAAQSQLAQLNRQGLHTARIGGRSVATNKVAFQLRELTPENKAQFDKIKPGFPAQELRSCK
jgi:hypothetical protein